MWQEMIATLLVVGAAGFTRRFWRKTIGKPHQRLLGFAPGCSSSRVIALKRQACRPLQ